MLHTYALAPDTLRRMLRRVFWRFQIITTISFLAFGLYLAWFGQPVNWQLAGPAVGLIALAYFFILFLNYRQQLRILYSVRYEIDNSSITYRQHGQEPLRVMRADITAVQERNDGLWIETVSGSSNLLVPCGLARDGDDLVRRTLSSWTGLDPAQGYPRSPVATVVLIGLGGAILVLLFANNLWLILLFGLAILAYGLYTERRLVRTSDAAPGTVRMYNLAFSFLIFVIIMKSCILSAVAIMAR